MIAVGDGFAAAALGATVVGMTTWASYLSVRSAALGPAWALGHLARSRPVLAAVPLVGVLASLFVEPRWMGLAVGYVGLVGAVMSWMLARNLARLRDSAGFGEIPLERRRALVSRARRRLTIAGAGLAGAGVVAIVLGVVGPGLVMSGMGVSLGVTAALIGVPDEASP